MMATRTEPNLHSMAGVWVTKEKKIPVNLISLFQQVKVNWLASSVSTY